MRARRTLVFAIVLSTLGLVGGRSADAQVLGEPWVRAIEDPPADGLCVHQVPEGTEGARIGLREGDVLVRIDDRPLRDLWDLVGTPPDPAGATLTVRRGTSTLHLRLASLPGVPLSPVRKGAGRSVRPPSTRPALRPAAAATPAGGAWYRVTQAISDGWPVEGMLREHVVVERGHLIATLEILLYERTDEGPTPAVHQVLEARYDVTSGLALERLVREDRVRRARLTLAWREGSLASRLEVAGAEPSTATQRAPADLVPQLLFPAVARMLASESDGACLHATWLVDLVRFERPAVDGYPMGLSVRADSGRVRVERAFLGAVEHSIDLGPDGAVRRADLGAFLLRAVPKAEALEALPPEARPVTFRRDG